MPLSTALNDPKIAPNGTPVKLYLDHIVAIVVVIRSIVIFSAGELQRDLLIFYQTEGLFIWKKALKLWQKNIASIM